MSDSLGLWGRIADNRDPRSLASALRRRRFARFAAFVEGLPRPVRVLDVGGTAAFWDAMGGDRAGDFDVTILNLETSSAPSRPGRAIVQGDARALAFEDGAFDVVFSNSVIEHVGSFEDQRRAAREMQRVGRRWFVQTPNRHFPIEPHFLFPFFQFLPIDARAYLLSRTRLGWMPRVPDRVEARRVVEEVRLLTRAELEELFPGSRIDEERVLGLVKSLVAIGASV